MSRDIRVLVLWSRLSGYMDASLESLVRLGRAKVHFVGQVPSAAEAPFDLTQLSASYATTFFDRPVDFRALARLATEFAPDIVLSGGTWREAAYRKLLKRFRTRACRVLCTDTQWAGYWRQWFVVMAMRAKRHDYYDKAFVAGNRQADYAKRMGFQSADIETGLYTCDFRAFATAGRHSNRRISSPSFLFVGRLIEIKGLKELLKGYQAYRKNSANPWPLYICGTGPLKPEVSQVTGVVYLDFVQPAELPAVMARHTVLVVPSHREPWGLVIHEAAAAGMGIICSRQCGSGDDFVRDGRNGTVLATISAGAIRDAMSRVSALSPDQLAVMSAFSRELAAGNSPEIWARRVLTFGAS